MEGAIEPKDSEGGLKSFKLVLGMVQDLSFWVIPFPSGRTLGDDLHKLERSPSTGKVGD